jgi:hypothetical protein
MGAYTRVARCHVLRGEHEEADRYIELVLRFVEHVGSGRIRGRSIHIPPLALALARRDRVDEALALLRAVPRSGSASVTLEALSEIAIERADWDEAAGLVPVAREEAATGGALSLQYCADRLEGRTAAARGETASAAALLRRAADGFAGLEARWEEARSRLLLGEALAGEDARAAERELAAALPVFEELGSVRELGRTRAARPG